MPRKWRNKTFLRYRQTSIKADDGVWNHICVSWEKSLGSWKFYKDGDLKQDGKDFKRGYTIKEGGALVLGQDQDSVGGGFETADSLKGMLSNVNVWDRVLSVADIKSSKSCLLGVGNVYRWTDFLREGGATLVQQSPCKRVAAGMFLSFVLIQCLSMICRIRGINANYLQVKSFFYFWRSNSSHSTSSMLI